MSVAAVLALAGCGFDAPAPDAAFDLNCTVSSGRLFDGGVGRNGIPALRAPEVVPAAEDTVLAPSDRVLGVVLDGAARAYPFIVLWWHEIVNDTLGGRPILVTYCPLTGSGLAFDPVVSGTTRLFGVSGLLFENNLVMFDGATESLWNQLLLGAVCGPERGTELARLPIVETSWAQWKAMHPATTVLTTNTGHARNYGTYPYGDYDQPTNPVLLFPSSPFSNARPIKERVLGIHEGNDAKAFPFGALADRGRAVAVNDAVGGRPVLVVYLAAGPMARAFDRQVGGQTLTFAVADADTRTLVDQETGSTWTASGVAVSGPLSGGVLAALPDAYTLFWFAWSVFHPESRLYL